MEPVRIFVGADRSQALAIKVLEYSIKRHTTLPIKLIPMVDLPIRAPKHISNSQRTGFSFSRFCIPELAGYAGKAIYMDADMLVFKDIRSLWELPFDGAKVVIQEEVKYQELTTRKVGAPSLRRKQCAVMLLDCGRLDWKIDRIIDGLDSGEYNYEMLMYDLCLVRENEIKYGVPFEWNSLEYYDQKTCLLHYTDVRTQPWTSCLNRNGEHWYNEVRLMLADGSLAMDELKQEIDLGYFRPSLLWDLRIRPAIPSVLRPPFDVINTWRDVMKRYQPHRDVYLAKKRRAASAKQASNPALS